MHILENHLTGQRYQSVSQPALLHDAVTGTMLAGASSAGLDLTATFDWVRKQDDAALRALSYTQYAALLARITVGNPRNQAVKMGALVSRAQFDNVRSGLVVLHGVADVLYDSSSAPQSTPTPPWSPAWHSPCWARACPCCTRPRYSA